MHTSKQRAVASVIIPAHNEEAVIERCLESLLRSTAPGELQVVVVCNGCTDETARVAREVSEDIEVVETDIASKSLAWDLGDSIATVFPRVYLDADVAVSERAVPALAERLRTSGKPVGGLTMRWPVPTGTLVDRYYAVWRKSPYFETGPIGAGFFALSESGRARFERFPPIIADDFFIDRMFGVDERCIDTSGWFEPLLPRTVPDLLRVQVRQLAANRELRDMLPAAQAGGATAGWLLREARSLGRIPNVAVFLCFRVLAEVLAAVRHRRGDQRWLRDRSTHGTSRDDSSGRAGVDVMGLPCDFVTEDELFARFEDALETGRRTLVFNVNLHALYLQRRDPQYRGVFDDADLIYVDGMPVVALARLGGRKVGRENRVTYLDWDDRLYQFLAERSLRVHYIGGTPEALAAGLAVLRQRHPSLLIDGSNGFFDHDPYSQDTVDLIELLNARRPDVVLVGMGMPIQETWAASIWPKIDVPLLIALGAGIDYAAGVTPSPPRWLGQIGFEWLYRLVREPRRLGRRYLVEPFALLAPALTHIASQRLARLRRG